MFSHLFILCFSFFLYSCFFSLSSVPGRSLDFPSHPKTPKKKTKNPKSKLQNPDQKASKRVCPTRVCPTRVSAHPSAQQLRPQRLKHLNPLLPFILMKKLSCLPMEFWFMSGLPQEFGQSFFLQIHQRSGQNVKLEITQKSLQSSAHKRFVSQKSGTHSKNVLGKISREFCLQVRGWVGAAPTRNNTKYCTRHF